MCWPCRPPDGSQDSDFPQDRIEGAVVEERLVLLAQRADFGPFGAGVDATHWVVADRALAASSSPRAREVSMSGASIPRLASIWVTS